MKLSQLVLVTISLVMLVNCSDDDNKVAGRAIFDSQINYVNPVTGQRVQPVAPDEAPTPEKLEQDAATARFLSAWKDTGFNETILRQEFVNGQICTLGEKQFVGCFYAINGMASFIYGDDVNLNFSGSTDEALGDVVANLGVFSVYGKKEVVLEEGALDDAMKAELEKKSVEYRKRTVAKLIEYYNSNVKTLTEVQSAQGAVQAFSEGWVALGDIVQTCRVQPDYVTADGKNCDQKTEAVIVDLNARGESMFTFGGPLESSVLAEWFKVFDEAFVKIKEEERPYYASNFYNIYLRNSADGHARIGLRPDVEAALEAAHPQNAPFFGIGATLKLVEDKGVYVDPREGSPAEQAGVELNDRIVSIQAADGAVIVPATTEEAVKYLRGEVNTPVSVTVEKWATKQEQTYTIVRGPVSIDTYDFEKRTVAGKTYGFLQINTFMDEAMGPALRKYVKDNDALVAGWILDMRDNGGGSVYSAAQVVSAFMPTGSTVMVYSLEDDLDRMDPNNRLVTSEDRVTTKPLVILVNGGSASASEIVSGTLQEEGRAVVVGERSFGKATVQSNGSYEHGDIKNYPVWGQFVDRTPFGNSPRLIVFQTRSRYFFPSGRTPEWVGVSPDFEVLSAPDAEELFVAREADIFTFSLVSVDLEWTRPQEQLTRNSSVQTCVGAQGTANAAWTEEVSKPFKKNFQDLYSYDVLGCLMGETMATPVAPANMQIAN